MGDTDFADQIEAQIVDALLDEFQNDHDYDPGYPYKEDAARYVAAARRALTAAGLTVSVERSAGMSRTVLTVASEWAADHGCGECRACYTAAGVLPRGIILCPKCGNKRCPKATDCRYLCTGSNEPGQLGSVY